MPRLRLEAHRTVLVDDTGAETLIDVGIRDIAEGLFRRDPPTPLEMEQAIDVVEEALAASGLRQGSGGELLIADPVLHASLRLTEDGMRLTRDEVEARFDSLAAASLGRPGALADQPPGGDAAAALLVLRECMHHLGYESVRRAQA